MKSKLLTFLLIFIHSLVHAQSIEWGENQLNGNNIPFYIGGFSRISTEFADIDGDNDDDCFIGTSDGNIVFFENAHNSSASSWKLTTLNYLDNELLTLDRIKVRFVDIDNDNDLDMFIGGNSSNINYTPLIFYKNIGTKFNPDWELVPDFIDNIEIGEISKFCFPAFVDIDNDDDFDLVYGNYKGYCIYYENIGDKNSFNFVKKSSNYFDLPRFSNCPNIEFYDVDGDLDLDAFVGTHYKLSLIENIGTPKNALWQEDTTNYLGINKYKCGTYYSPTFADFDNNGKSDLYVGTNNGTLWTHDTISSNWVKYNEIYFDEGSYLNPEFADLDGDLKEELFIPVYDEYHDTSYIEIYKNNGNVDSIVWESVPDTMFVDFPYPLNRVTFADINNDDKLDLIVGFKNFIQDIYLYKNIGTKNSPVFDDNFEVIAQFREDRLDNFYPLIVDYDNDSDLDMIISAQSGTMNSYGWVDFFENVGDSTLYNWEFSSSQVLGYGSIACVDDDNDNDLDLLFGFISAVTVVQNTGNINKPVFNFLHSLKIEKTNNVFSGIAIADLNNDFHKDLVIGTASGGLLRFDNKGFTDGIEIFDNEYITIFPNPTSNYITISGLNLPASNYNFFIYSNFGQLVGKFEINNTAISLSALKNGLYIYKLQQDKTFIKTGKLIIQN